MRARQWLIDARRVVGGSALLVRHLLTRDRVDVGLAQLSARAPTVARGSRNRYDVTVANARPQAITVTLHLEIRAADASPVEGRDAGPSRRLDVPPRASTDVEMEYDWLAVDRPGPYAVSAVLLDAQGRRLDAVTVYQRLAP
jgi:hypothetical protein